MTHFPNDYRCILEKKKPHSITLGAKVSNLRNVFVMMVVFDCTVGAVIRN